MTTRMSTLLGDDFWVICPKLEQRREGPPPPPLVVVGGITFYFKREAFLEL
jgi:hypothetical protein